MSFVNQFINSSAYSSLLAEANTNVNAIELLEIINLTIESLVFFLENNIENRAQQEQHNLNKVFQYIHEIYEETN